MAGELKVGNVGTIEQTAWHALHIDQVLDDLQVHESGVTAEEAAERLQRFGPNQLEEARPTSFLATLWEQLNNFVVLLLIGASAVSALLGEWVDAGAILAIVVLNTVLGIIQERRAEQALAALKRLAAPEAQVMRAGHRMVIPARELVPGDIVFLEAGNYVPADVRLAEAVNLRIEEASLTGESLPVQKNSASVLERNVPLGDRKNTAFMGTLVSYGRGRGVVTSTGMNTQLGLIASMLQNVEEEVTPLQRRLDQLGRTLSCGALFLVAIVFVVALINNTEIGFLFAAPLLYLSENAREITEVFIIAVSLAIAAVPEGLPAVVTISLALGMREMIRRHALIRKLASVETLGSATVICSDKTGTLTKNEMTVTRLWADGTLLEITGSGYAPVGGFMDNGQVIDIADYPGARTALWLGVLNNDAELEAIGMDQGEQTYRIVGDPTEGALLVAAAKGGAYRVEMKKAYPRESEVPFDSERKRMITVHDVKHPQPDDPSPFYDMNVLDWDVIAVKGAPDVVLGFCSHYQTTRDVSRPLTDEKRREILDANDAMTKGALRVLGLAYRLERDVPDDIQQVSTDHLEKDLVFAGLVGMIDPPREEVRPALAKAQMAGIRTIMITGDYPNTARAIAESIGLIEPGHRVLTGPEINTMDAEALQREVAYTDVFARVSPEHKLRIVEALRARGQVVAMTGDGVNDAPSIKRADIGVAMGISGTDVAKESADMVLTDDNYASIVAAIEQGRVIYSNIRKFVYYLLSCNLAEIAIIFLGTLFTRSSPLTAIQLLWLNLVTDGAPALALGTEKGDPDIMSQPPRPPSEPITNRFMQIGIAAQTIAITVTTMAVYLFGYRDYPTQSGLATTMAFVTLSLAELPLAYTARSERFSLLKIGPFSNRNMNLAVLSSFLLMMAVVYIPFLQPVFDTVPLGWAQWKLILPMAILPSIAAELIKFIFRRRANLKG